MNGSCKVLPPSFEYLRWMFAPHPTHVHDIKCHCRPRHSVLHRVQLKVFPACECCHFLSVSCLSLCGSQLVSAPHLVSVVPCPDMSLCQQSPEGTCPSAGRSLSVSSLVLPPLWSTAHSPHSVPLPLHLHILLPCPSVSPCQWTPEDEYPYSVPFFLHPDMSLPLQSPEGEYPSLGHTPSAS